MKAIDKIEKMLMPNEEVLWSGKPDVLQAIVYGGWLETGTIFVALGLAGLYFPEPVPLAFTNIPQCVPMWGRCCLGIGILTILVSSICFYLWAHVQCYAVTNKRLLFVRLPLINKHGNITVLVVEAHNINSIAVVQEIKQIGCVRIALQATQRLSILLGYECRLDHVRDPIAVSKVIATTFAKPITTRSTKLPLSYVYYGYRSWAESLYWPAKGQSRSIALMKSLLIWVGLLLLTWFWVGSIPHNLFWAGFLVVSTVAITHGLFLFLSTNLSR